MPKHTLRQAILAARKSLPSQDRCISAELAQRNLLDHPAYERASTLALYLAVRGETDTQLIAESCLEDGKKLLFPSVCGDRMVFRRIASLAELIPGPFGIPEPPSTAREMEASDVDMVVVPGVAFDTCGRRLGYGRGYYDRLLHPWEGEGRFFGLCYDFQVVEKIVDEPHDVLMDWVITDRRVIGPLRKLGIDTEAGS